MITTTTDGVQGKKVSQYHGLVSGESVIGANAIKDFTASLSDFFGGRSDSYEKVLLEAKDTAIKEMEEHAQKMGADAVVGVDLDYESLGSGNSMLMVVCSGTAVNLQDP
ncbi:MAG: YbjQ family protein [Flavobacteriales bacterium]